MIEFPANFENDSLEEKYPNLYRKLIVQLNKDFLFSNIETCFETSISPTDLKVQLSKVIFGLLQNNFSEYLNLLYRIDVSEKKINNLEYQNIQEFSEKVAFLILLREWQKVSLKEKF